MPLDIDRTAPTQADAPTSAPTDNSRVISAITHHHAALADDLRTLTAAVLDAARSGVTDEPRAALAAWFVAELLPHAHAEEVALYSLGSQIEGTRLLVDAMVAEHRAIATLVDELRVSSDPVAVSATAAAAQVLFTVHLGKENDLLLPALDAAGVDLGAALDGMHEVLGAVSPPSELDVRDLPHGGRHEIIFGRLDGLLPGETFVIINDHDPKPLRYQTEALWPEAFTWNYLEAGPAVWRVAITRAG